MSFNKPHRQMLDDDVFGTAVNLAAGSTVGGVLIGAAPSPFSGGNMNAGGWYSSVNGSACYLPSLADAPVGSTVITSKLVTVSSVQYQGLDGADISIYDAKGDLLGTDTAVTLDSNSILYFVRSSSEWECKIL